MSQAAGPVLEWVDADAAPVARGERAERWARKFGWIAIGVCIIVAYANSISAPLVFDGANYLRDADTVRDISSWDKLVQLLDKGQTRALAYLTFALDYQLYEYDVRGWHATSIAVHIFGALALYGVARHGFGSLRAAPYFTPVRERMALIAALIWSVHPLNTQSVTYLYQRQEALMGMFYLLTLYLMTRLATSGRWHWAVLSVVACIAGMASKEVMITCPLVVIWYDRVFCASSWGELVRRRGAYYVALAGSWSMLSWLMSRTYPVYASAGILDVSRVTPMEYGVTQLSVVARYVRLALLPYGLNIDYAWQKACTWPLPDAAGTITWLPTEINGLGFARASAIVGGLLLLTLIALFRAPALGFLGGAFFTALAPTSSVAPIVDLCFEHRTYVALAPLLTLVVIAVRSGWVRISQRFGLSAAVTSAILEVAAWLAVATLVALTMVRNHDYRSELALWGDAAAKAPGNPRAQYNYGVYLQIAGETPQAIEQYLRTIELDPGYTDAYLNLGRIAVFEKRLEDADRHFNDLLEKAIPIEGYSQHLEAAQTLAQLRYDHDDLGMARYYLDRKFQFLDELLKHDPEHAEGLKSQAEARELLQKIEAALRRPPAAAPSGSPAPTSTSPTATSTARF